MTPLWDQKREECQEIGELAEALQDGKSRVEIIQTVGYLAFMAAGNMGKRDRQEWIKRLRKMVNA